MKKKKILMQSCSRTAILSSILDSLPPLVWSKIAIAAIFFSWRNQKSIGKTKTKQTSSCRYFQLGFFCLEEYRIWYLTLSRMSGQTNKPFKQRKSFCKQNKITCVDFFGAKWFGEGDAMCIGGIIRHPSSLENKYFYALFLSHLAVFAFFY